MTHPIIPPCTDRLDDCGKQLAYLRYDAMLIVLQGFYEEVERQRACDARKGRTALAQLGTQLSNTVLVLIHIVERMLAISERHMRDDFIAWPLPPYPSPDADKDEGV